MPRNNTPPLRATPTKNTEDALDKFAQAAGTAPAAATASEILPWEEPHVREDVVKNLPLRLNEPLYLKLKYIASKTPYSMNSFIIEKIEQMVDEEIERLAGV